MSEQAKTGGQRPWDGSHPPPPEQPKDHVTDHKTPTNSEHCNHGKGWTVDCEDCGRRGTDGGEMLSNHAVRVRLEMLEHAVFVSGKAAQSERPIVVGSVWRSELGTNVSRGRTVESLDERGVRAWHVLPGDVRRIETWPVREFRASHTWLRDPEPVAQSEQLIQDRGSSVAGNPSPTQSYVEKGVDTPDNPQGRPVGNVAIPQHDAASVHARAVSTPVPDSNVGRIYTAPEPLPVGALVEIVKVDPADPCPGHKAGRQVRVGDGNGLISEHIESAYLINGKQISKRTLVRSVRLIEEAPVEPNPARRYREFPPEPLPPDCDDHMAWAHSLSPGQVTSLWFELDAATHGEVVEMQRAEIAKLRAENEALRKERDKALADWRFAEQSLEDRDRRLTTTEQKLARYEPVIEALDAVDVVYKEVGTGVRDVFEEYVNRVMPAMRAVKENEGARLEAERARPL